MRDADKYRANARYCLTMAERAARAEERNMWREMAETWLGMIPQAQRDAPDQFEALARKRGTGQEPSTSEH
jgi:hypothetical protein